MPGQDDSCPGMKMISKGLCEFLNLYTVLTLRHHSSYHTAGSSVFLGILHKAVARREMLIDIFKTKKCPKMQFPEVSPRCRVNA